MEIWFCFLVTEVERSVGATPGAAGATAGGSRGLSPSPAPSSPSTPVATSPSASASSTSSSPSPFSSSASALVAGLDKSVLQVSSLSPSSLVRVRESVKTMALCNRRAHAVGEILRTTFIFPSSPRDLSVPLKYLFPLAMFYLGTVVRELAWFAAEISMNMHCLDGKYIEI